ncbi:hypothetical protein ZIOFF_069531 [Zingiber officinale]|uniref:Uncharacterized protein n=1 Tax=Zingiber officinale TaxID=94328 RepID=A0A8J5CVZ3_ZINOF|nr:hypothetical protein ZIOFF_069531 [Zingiber officinale]
MVLTSFDGVGIGLGFGIGCGFGVGWGFGGMPLNTFGMGIGGGCGVGFGLGWGFGTAFGCKYRTSKVSFQGLENGNERIRDETSVPVSSKQSHMEREDVHWCISVVDITSLELGTFAFFAVVAAAMVEVDDYDRYVVMDQLPDPLLHVFDVVVSHLPFLRCFGDDNLYKSLCYPLRRRNHN